VDGRKAAGLTPPSRLLLGEDRALTWDFAGAEKGREVGLEKYGGLNGFSDAGRTHKLDFNENDANSQVGK